MMLLFLMILIKLLILYPPLMTVYCILCILANQEVSFFDSTNAIFAFIYSHLLPIYKTQFQFFFFFDFRFGFCSFVEFFVKSWAALIDFGALTRRKVNTHTPGQQNYLTGLAVGRNELGYRSVNWTRNCNEIEIVMYD